MRQVARPPTITDDALSGYRGYLRDTTWTGEPAVVHLGGATPDATAIGPLAPAVRGDRRDLVHGNGRSTYNDSRLVAVFSAEKTDRTMLIVTNPLDTAESIKEGGGGEEILERLISHAMLLAARVGVTDIRQARGCRRTCGCCNC